MITITIGSEDRDRKINQRNALRAIIFNDDKLLMIKTNKGDYKFPGGGIESNESNFEALSREISEETGYTLIGMGEKLVEIIECHEDKYDKKSIFKMISLYYECMVSKEPQVTSLEPYEARLNFKAEWVDIFQAITTNSFLLHTQSHNINAWVYRETEVLKSLT